MRHLLALALGCVASAQIPCFDTLFGTAIGAGDDVVLPMQAIGFPFPFAGNTYTHVHVSTNGFLYLSNAGIPAPGNALCCNGTPDRLVTGSPKICALLDNLIVIAAQGSFVWLNSGPTACTITWDNVKEYGNNIPFDLQCRLLPDGQVRFTYHGEAGVRLGGDALVGVSPAGGAAIPAANDLSVGGGTALATCYQVFDNFTRPFDLAGVALTFTPNGAGWNWSPGHCLATSAPYGHGCVAVTNTFYEDFAPGTIDLAGTSMRLTRSANGYTASVGTATWVAPPTNAQQLSLFDDWEQHVVLAQAMPVTDTTTTFLTVCSNGFVSVGSGNSTQPTPAPVSLLSMGRTVFASWHDYDPSAPGGGKVWFHQANGFAWVTWDGVADAQVTGPGNWFQFRFELATGNVDYVWGSLSGLGNGHLVGFHPGGISQDGGSIDLSARLPATVSVPNEQVVPLRLEILSASNGGVPPRLGATTYLYTQNVPLGAPFGALWLGFTDPDLDLTPVGMPGCRQYVDPLASVTFLPVQRLGTSTFAVPIDPVFVGAVLLAQSFVYSPAHGLTPLGAVAANGLRMTIGW
ncbi:MAG: hypothetical protein IPK26_00995 [Planctomycetes bacterium]|nr:hypothetical protein [Planctomycetota bacterium]